MRSEGVCGAWYSGVSECISRVCACSGCVCKCVGVSESGCVWVRVGGVGVCVCV